MVQPELMRRALLGTAACAASAGSMVESRPGTANS